MHVSHQNDALHRDPLSSLRYERSPDTANKLRFVVITGIDRDHPARFWLRFPKLRAHSNLSELKVSLRVAGLPDGAEVNEYPIAARLEVKLFSHSHKASQVT